MPICHETLRVHFGLPILSSLNGPSNLAYLVQQIETVRLHPRSIRLTPHFGHALDREIMPYRELHAYPTPKTSDIHPRNALHAQDQAHIIHLQVNLRDDNRLRRYVPLITVGLLPNAAMHQDWDQMLALYEQEHQQRQAKLQAKNPSNAPLLPVTAQQCFESLIEQLVNRYPYLADLDSPYDVPDHRAVLPKRQDLGVFEESAEWYTWRCQTRTLRELIQAFFTLAFLLIGSVDLMGGREYVFPVVLEEPICAVPLKTPISVNAVADWLQAFPHYPAEQVHMSDTDYSIPRQLPERPVLRMPSFAPTEPLRQTEESEMRDITRETLIELGALWTSADPAVRQLSEALQQIWEAKGELPNTWEILALVHRFVPDYLPTQPAQARLIGGWDLTLLLLRHIEYRWKQTPFLGVSVQELEIFEPVERDLIKGLLILRRTFADPVHLFHVAARIAVGSDVEVWWELYQPIGCELGSDRAALGVSLAISVLAQLHEPRINVYLPIDRTEYPKQADFAMRKLKCLQRLFLPAHIQVIYQWETDWAILGETAFLCGPAHGSAARLATTEIGYNHVHGNPREDKR